MLQNAAGTLSLYLPWTKDFEYCPSLLAISSLQCALLRPVNDEWVWCIYFSSKQMQIELFLAEKVTLMERDQDAVDSNSDSKRIQFGSRFLTDPHAVFEHNAW